MLKIEIFQEDVNVTTRTTSPKDDRPGRTFYEQTAYAHLGGKFPVQMKLQVENPASVYPAGIYEINASSFMVNNYGGLELKRFGFTISKLPEQGKAS